MSTVNRPLLFISYDEKDSVFAHQLAEALRDAEVDRYIWLFEDELKGGVRSQQEIEVAIKKATHLIPILSRNSRKAKGVHDEIVMARMSKKPIIPVLLRLRRKRDTLSYWGLPTDTWEVTFPNGFELKKLPEVLRSLPRRKLAARENRTWDLAKELYHYPDVKVRGSTFVAEPLKATWLVYGPYVDLDAGDYVASFDIEAGAIAGDDAIIGFIDVVARHIQLADKRLAHRTLTHSDLSASGRYDPRRLRFYLSNKETDVEFRLLTSGVTRLTAKCITLERLT